MFILFIIQEIIIFMTPCKLSIGNYKGLYLACIMQTWMSAALWGISGNGHTKQKKTCPDILI